MTVLTRRTTTTILTYRSVDRLERKRFGSPPTVFRMGTERTALGRADTKKRRKTFVRTDTDDIRPPATGDLPQTTLIVAGRRRRRRSCELVALPRGGGGGVSAKLSPAVATYTVLWAGRTDENARDFSTFCLAFSQLRFLKTVIKTCCL